MNADIAEAHGIPYIDVRKAFMEVIPFHQLYYKGCVTYDGEHLNSRGMKIAAKLFVGTILEQWLVPSNAAKKDAAAAAAAAAASAAADKDADGEQEEEEPDAVVVVINGPSAD